MTAGSAKGKAVGVGVGAGIVKLLEGGATGRAIICHVYGVVSFH